MWKKTDKDILLLSQVAKEITGCNFEYIERPAINCIDQRMESLQFEELVAYIDFALKNKGEFARLVSSLTIHTTYWFREPKHFSILKKWIIERLEQTPNLVLKVWSAACSTGEEVYSLACLFESIREKYPGFYYSILGTDIDSLSVNHARSAVYTEFDKDKFGEYSRFIKFIDENNSKFTLIPEILNRCYFDVMSLFELKIPPKTIDVVFIRNVLIYFNAIEIKKIINQVKDILTDDGLLVTGMSESILSSDFVKLENTVYQRSDSKSSNSSKIYYFGSDKVFTKKYFALIDDELEIINTDDDYDIKMKVAEFKHHTHVYFDLSDKNFKKYLDLLGSLKNSECCRLHLVYNSESPENHISKAFKYKLNFAGFINKAFVSKKSLSFYLVSRGFKAHQSH